MIPIYLSPLANHLWQSSLFAGVAGLLALALRKNRASIRYWLWFAASLKFLIPFSLLVSIGSHIEWRSAPRTTQAQLPVVMDQIAQPFASSAPADLPKNLPSALNVSRIVLFGVWLCGVATRVWLWLRAWRRVRATVRIALPLRADLKNGRASIKVMCAPSMLEPCVFGVFRPVLLLPNGIQDRLTPEQLEAILAHELSHIRRNDNLTAAIHMAVETLFWFYPIVSWVGNRLMDEREHACDEEVLRSIGKPEIYAQGILNVCKFCLESSPVCAAGITGSSLKKRIEGVMTNPIAQELGLGRKLLITTAAMIALSAPLLVGLLNAPFTQAQSHAPARPS